MKRCLPILMFIMFSPVSMALDASSVLARLGYREVNELPRTCTSLPLHAYAEYGSVDRSQSLSVSSEAQAKHAFRYGLPMVRSETSRYEILDQGEWGGGLMLSEKGRAPHRIIENTPTTLLLNRDTMIVPAGSDHLGLDYGALYVVENWASKPQPRFVTLLPGKPIVSFFDERLGELYILTRRTLSWLSTNGRRIGPLRVLSANDFEIYEGDANSIAVTYPDIVIGRRCGLTVVTVPEDRIPLGPGGRKGVRHFQSSANQSLQRTGDR